MRWSASKLCCGVASLALALVAGAAVAAPGGLKRASVAEKPRRAPAGERPVAFDRRWLEPYFTKPPLAAPAEAFRREDWKKAITGLTSATARLPRSAPERAPGRYLLALAHMSSGDWASAGELFEALYEQHPLLAPYHAHYAARCRLRRGDSEGALLWARKVPEGAVLEAETVLIEIDALAALERWAEVGKTAGRFLERFPAGPRRAEAMYRRAEAMEKIDAPVADIAALYRRIWSEAPLEAWSRRAEERLRALVARQPAAAGKGAAPDLSALAKFSADEWLQRGMLLFERNQNEESEAAFASTLAALPATGSPDIRCKAEFHRAQSVFKQRQRTRAAPLFARAETACREAGNTDLIVKSLYQAGRCLQNIGQYDEALKKYAAIEKEAPAHSYADDARLRAAEVHREPDGGAPEQAAALLSSLPDAYPTGDQAAEALWRLALAAILQKDWDQANKWLDENLRRFPREEIWFAEGRALYWKARVAVVQGAKPAALGFYTRAIREYPLSVYTFLSLERMRVEFPEARRKLLRELRADLLGAASKSKWQFAPRPVFGRPEFRRAVELARLGLGSDARRELHRMGLGTAETRDRAREQAAAEAKQKEESAPAGKKPGKAGKPVEPESTEQEDVTWITAILLDRGRSWAAAHAIPRYTLKSYREDYPRGKREAMWRLAFPRAFPEIVGPNSKTNRVPEWLQLAIMREESAFNPRIESIANALGLTQMLVATARRFSDRPVSRETLLDPARNVEVGSRFLAFLLDRFGGKAPLAIAGYNAGEGAVGRWLGERGDLPLDEFMETIPYDETRNYTKRVLSSYLTYAWLYDATRPVPELSFSLKSPPRAERSGRHAPPRRPR